MSAAWTSPINLEENEMSKDPGMMIIGGILSAACFIGSWLAPEWGPIWTLNMFFAAGVFVEGYNKYHKED